MSTHITRHFIGPLTLAQQEQRRRARYRWHDIAEVMDARYCSFVEAVRVLKIRHGHRFDSLCPERTAYHGV